MSTTSRTDKKTFSKGRVKRGPPPMLPNPIRARTYRKCLPELKRDFECRCAYCMRSLAKLSDREMQVDHFDPRRKKDRIQRYSNFFLADAHCNGMKSDTWPSREAQKKGVRFLNCCEEMDYGCCVFEDPATHELVGMTPAAIYHIEMIDLNAPHLIKKRRERAEVRALLMKKGGYLDLKDESEIREVWMRLERIVEEELIPPIPPPPQEINLDPKQRMED